MSDWLSQVEAKKKREEAQRNARAAIYNIKQEKEKEHERISYENNKNLIDQIYSQAEAYVEQAARMGYPVKSSKYYYSLSIENNRSPKGNPTIYLKPDGNKLEVRYHKSGVDRYMHTKKVSYDKVSYQLISYWVGWVAEDGAKPGMDDADRGFYQMLAYGCLIIIGIIALIIATFVIGISYFDL